jgi:hypothetical protein
MSSQSLACKLTQQHGAIVGAMRSGRQHENRRAPRFEHRARGQINPVVDGQLQSGIAVQLADFSNRGIGFHLCGKMARGEQFVFRLPREDGGSTPVLCTVAYCRKSSESDFRIGAEFTCIVSLNGTCIVPDNDDVDRIRQSILS